METWYQDFVSTPDDAVEALMYELRPHASFLGSLNGRILDVGGGAGLSSIFLPPEAELFVVDPSTIWLEEPWPTIKRQLVPERPDHTFVEGFGEELPFSASSFDAALSFWSLNHASDPARCLGEMHRVLRKRSKLLLVLEDMEPNWRDVLRLAVQDATMALGRLPEEPLHWHQEDLKTAMQSATRKLSGLKWPLQDDHLRIHSIDLERWVAGKFRIVRRQWVGGFLTLELMSI